MSLYTDSESVQIATTTIHSTLLVLNIVGNSLVCAIIIKNQDMRYAVGAKYYPKLVSTVRARNESCMETCGFLFLF